MNRFMQTQKKIERAVVDGYRATETGVVSGYKKIEDSFVEAFLTPDEGACAAPAPGSEKEREV